MPRFPAFRTATASAQSGGTSGAWVFVGDMSNIVMQLSPGAGGSVPSCTYLVEGTIDQADSTPAGYLSAVTAPGYNRIFSVAVTTSADMSAVGLASCGTTLGGASTTLETYPIRFIRLKINSISQGSPHLKIFGYVQSPNT